MSSPRPTRGTWWVAALPTRRTSYSTALSSLSGAAARSKGPCLAAALCSHPLLQRRTRSPRASLRAALWARERSSPRGVHARGTLRRRSRAPSYFSTLTGSVGHRNTHIYTYSGPARSPSSSTASVRAGTSRSSTTATTAPTSGACSSGCRCHRRANPNPNPIPNPTPNPNPNPNQVRAGGRAQWRGGHCRRFRQQWWNNLRAHRQVRGSPSPSPSPHPSTNRHVHVLTNLLTY